jgi:bifunctional NMN adenylyltransferase/nudix hydrolase
MEDILKTANEEFTVEGVGVIVGRFQASELTPGHKELFDSVIARHQKTICVIGLSPVKATKNNPLDFESRRKMILESYPEITIVYQKDAVSNESWSKTIDENISMQCPPNAKVTLYGSRDSFIQYYSGRYDTKELVQRSFVSGTADRIRNSYDINNSKEFRQGAIWATQNQYDGCHPTVDIAIIDRPKNRILLGRKPNQTKFRFVGGFVDPNMKGSKSNYLEQNARREVNEESHLETGKLEYVDSFQVDDWRYRGETNKIVTILFKTDYVFGAPKPDDDICELRWFDLTKEEKLFSKIVDEHAPLLNAFLKSEDLIDLMIAVKE